ncbi:MAG: FAD-dependent oxidoreductase [Solirubrobacterales bacterium]|nr:FAD-dependent oxidoreductase [Solirubrobacterales bacterium]
MADRHVDHLLIGGGIASANCARWLRESGGEGSILVVGREPDPPYNRPPCSKAYLQGNEAREATYFRPGEWWSEQAIDLITGASVMKLDTQERVATLSNKEQISFDSALIATGANVRLLRVDGAQLDGIHYLRTLRNADTIRGDLEGRENIVLIGGSYIGTEVAAALTQMGKKVTIVMQENLTLERGFGSIAGAYFQRVLEQHGVRVVGNETLDHFEGEQDRVTTVVTESGLKIPADLVVIGAGAAPDTMLAKAAGLELAESGGIRCSARLLTSAPGIYAAGDVCEYDSQMHAGPIRLEHWDVAFSHGKTVALNMLGADVAHEVVPYFFSDLADWAAIEYVGPAYGWDREIVRGSLDDGAFSIWYMQGGRLAGALSVGRSEDLEHARRLIAARTELVEASETLGDLEADLAGL